jgi:hypothetical protein
MTLKVVNTPSQDPPTGAGAGTDAPGPQDPAPQPAQPTAPRTPWHERVRPFGRWAARHLGTPRTRLAVVGVILLLVGILWITNSVWTLPLIVVGIVMVVIAWMGSRLDGRFAVEWGEAGTQVEFRAQIKAPPAAAHGVQLHPLPSASAPAPARPQIDDGTVIEGEGHTVEIDVAELKTLIRAAEARESTAPGEASPGSSDERSAA